MKRGFMVEKQASSEIAQSRERFEKCVRANKLPWTLKLIGGEYTTSWECASWWTWQAAERDTRERVAQEIKEIARRWRDPGSDIVDFLVERIRGKE
jgi:hypothetical protein